MMMAFSHIKPTKKVYPQEAQRNSAEPTERPIMIDIIHLQWAGPVTTTDDNDREPSRFSGLLSAHQKLLCFHIFNTFYAPKKENSLHQKL